MLCSYDILLFRCNEISMYLIEASDYCILIYFLKKKIKGVGEWNPLLLYY
jgi:hypothetical protein